MHKMLHGMAAPHGIIAVAETERGVEAFGIGIALVHEQGGRKPLGCGTRYDGLKKARGNASAAILRINGKRIDVELSGLRLVIHT